MGKYRLSSSSILGCSLTETCPNLTSQMRFWPACCCQFLPIKREHFRFVKYKRTYLWHIKEWHQFELFRSHWWFLEHWNSKTYQRMKSAGKQAHAARNSSERQSTHHLDQCGRLARHFLRHAAQTSGLLDSRPRDLAWSVLQLDLSW